MAQQEKKRVNPEVLRLMMWDEAAERLENIAKNTEEIKDIMTDIAIHMIKIPEAP